jgi:hypothetical protein
MYILTTGSLMTAGQQYRAKALEYRDLAQNQSNYGLSTEYEYLAAAYLRLAEQAERGDRPFIVEFELPVKSDEPKSEN